MSVHDGRLSWTVWARRDGWDHSDPKRMRGSVRIDPRDVLFGPLRYQQVKIGERVTAVVRMPAPVVPGAW
ncbi:hypothetical protein [Pseudonocardia humida]|uniref:Uncharacterized protein n=1 Tax=Pseudonocardia humida TaxID=2800819 RepID=A0ABT1A791_9PSEU|nr:hypothetical protein [Pseudonocardia humida]MCO1658869.1 hypothetical protein [Pseudonocardia humida]